MMGTEQTRVPTGSVPAVSGPCSTISAQNSWPNTQSAAGSSAGHADRVHQPGEVGEVGQGVQVGPADAGGERADDDVARGRHGVGRPRPPPAVHPSSPPHACRNHPPDGAAARIRRYVCPVSFTHGSAGRPFAGQVALVTGAARPRGIGRATALALARGGADVGLPRHRPALRRGAGHGTGQRRRPRLAGGRDRSPRRAGHDGGGRRLRRGGRGGGGRPRVTDALGTVSLVANVAGGSGPGFGLGPLLGVPADEFRRVLDVNVVGTWLVSKACATRMVAAGVGGRICNVSSQAGKRAFPFLGPYCAAKAGVILLTQTMALELGPGRHRGQRGVPGHGRHRPDQQGRHVREPDGRPRGPGRLHRPRDPARAACRAPRRSPAPSAGCSRTRPAGVTGEALNVSAGQTMV